MILLLNFFHNERFENVAELEVIELLESNAALIALCDLAYVVLETAERGDLILINHDTVTYYADLRLTGDLTVLNVRARNEADVRNVDATPLSSVVTSGSFGFEQATAIPKMVRSTRKNAMILIIFFIFIYLNLFIFFDLRQ